MSRIGWSRRIQGLRKVDVDAIPRKLPSQLLPLLHGVSRFAFALHQHDDALREIEPVARNMAHLARLRAEALDPGGPQHDRAEMTERLYRLDLQAGTGHRRIDDDTRLRIGSAD